MNEAQTALLASIEQNTGAPPDTANGLQVHPSSLANYGPTLVEGGSSPVYSSARQLLKTYSENLSAMRAADTAVRQTHPGVKLEIGMTGGTKNSIDPNRLEEFSKSLDIAFSKCGKAHDAARLTISTSLDALNSEVASKLKDPAANNVSRAQEAGEVRAMIRALKPAERMGAVGDLIKAGDLPAVAAVLHSSPIITGLNSKSLGILKSLAEAQFAGPIATRRDVTQKVLQHIDAASQEFVSKFSAYRPRPNAQTSATAARAMETLRSGAARVTT